MFKTGLVSISFRKNDVEEIIRKVSEAKLEYVEWGSDVHAPFDNFRAISNINSISEQYGVKTSSYGTYFKVGRDDPNDIKNYFSAAKSLGTNVLRVWIGLKGSADFSKEEKQRAYEDCIAISDMANDEGIVICCECHPKTLTDDVNSTLELMQNVSRDNFKMYWQPNQFISVEDNVLCAEKIAPYTVNIHVFNWKEKERYPLIESVDIWKRYLDKFDGTQTLLLEFMPDDDINSLYREAEALRRIIE